MNQIQLSRVKKFVVEHKIITFIFIIQALFILFGFIGLFGKGTDVIFDNQICLSQEINEKDSVVASYSIGKLRPSRYEITVEYDANISKGLDSSWNGESLLDLCSVTVYSNKIPLKILGDSLKLKVDYEKITEPFWINSLTNCDDAYFNIVYQGIGNVNIKNIQIKESVYFRFTRFLSILIICFLVSFFVLLAVRENSAVDKLVFFSLLGIVVFSSLPMFYKYLYYGHDMDFHIARIGEIACAIQAGNWNIKIQPNMINGYGYATPLFYPQLFLYIPALLYVVGFPLHTSYQIFITIINLATTIITYYCINKVINNKRIAVFGSLLYVTSLYRISELYVAQRLGEIQSMVFFPLIIYGIFLIYSKTEKLRLSDALPLILGITGVLQSHLVSSLFCGMFLVLFALISLKKTININRLCVLIFSVFAVLALNAWFIVPFVDLRDIDIQVYGNSVLLLQGSGVYLLQIFNIFQYGRGLNVPMWTNNEFALTMGVSLILGVGLFIYSYLKDKNDEGNAIKKCGLFCAAFAIFSVIATLEIFPWDELNNIIPKFASWLAKIEFSWRILSVGVALATFATAIGIAITQRKNLKLYSIMLAVIGGLSVISASFMFSDFAFYDSSYAVYSTNSTDKFALGVTNDYQLAGSDIGMCYERHYDTESDKILVNDYSSENGITKISCRNEDSGFQKIIIPLFSYEGYRAYDSITEEEFYIEPGPNKKIMINIPSGYDGTVIVDYHERTVWRLAEIVSIITAMALIVIWRLDINRTGKEK